MMSSAMFKRLAPGTFPPLPGSYSPESPPGLQALLRALAAIDFEFQKDRETILSSAIDEPLKQSAIATLAKRHQERRAPYLRGMDKLARQIQRKAA
jgi:hypothetical protein